MYAVSDSRVIARFGSRAARTRRRPQTASSFCSPLDTPLRLLIALFECAEPCLARTASLPSPIDHKLVLESLRRTLRLLLALSVCMSNIGSLATRARRHCWIGSSVQRLTCITSSLSNEQSRCQSAPAIVYENGCGSLSSSCRFSSLQPAMLPTLSIE